MKYLLLVMLLVSTLFAQTDITANGGTVTGPIGGRSIFLKTSSSVIAVNGQTDTGNITIQTGPKVNDPQSTQMTGDAFTTGGSASITSDSLGILFSGRVLSATWQLTFLSNLQHFYTLTGNLDDGNGHTGVYIVTTIPSSSITCFFNGQETIDTVAIVLN